MNLDLSFWCRNPAGDAFISEKRTYDIEFPFLATRSTDVRITLPSGFHVVNPMQSGEQEDDVFSYHVACDQSDDALLFQRDFVIKTATVQVAHYKEEKHLIDTIRERDNQQVVLQSGP